MNKILRIVGKLKSKFQEAVCSPTPPSDWNLLADTPAPCWTHGRLPSSEVPEPSSSALSHTNTHSSTCPTAQCTSCHQVDRQGWKRATQSKAFGACPPREAISRGAPSTQEEHDKPSGAAGKAHPAPCDHQHHKVVNPSE